MSLDELTSYKYRRYAFDFEIVVNVGARLSLLEKFAYIIKVAGNRDNLMGLYLSRRKKADSNGAGKKTRDGEGQRGREPTVKKKFRGPIYRTRLSPREKEIGIETKITDSTFPVESSFRPSRTAPFPSFPTYTGDSFPK